MKTIFVFGAGSDAGIFPLTNHLVSAINRFLETDDTGKKVNSLLKKKLHFANFSYYSIMDNAAYNFLRRNDPDKIESLSNRLDQIDQGTLNQEQKNQLSFIKNLTENLRGIPKKERDKKSITEFPKSIELAEKISLTKKVTVCQETTVSMFLRQSLRMLLRQYLADSKNKVLHTLFKSTVSLDEILLEYFLGFYNGNKSNMRRYGYLLWTMWAFFVETEIKYHETKNKNEITNIYQMLKNYNAITLNYTTLASEKNCKSLIHFHGSVLDYIDCQTREERRIQSFKNLQSLGDNIKLNSAEILEKDVLPLMEINQGKKNSEDKWIIPSMMPPFEIKPIIANDLIDTWHNAFQQLRNSQRIVVIGYSFNHTDSHFNDIILNLAGKKKNGNWEKIIYIINPDRKSIHKYFSKLPSLANTKWEKITLPNTDLDCTRIANIILIPGTTMDILGKTGNRLSLTFEESNSLSSS